MPAWRRFRTFQELSGVPTCTLEAARYIRHNSSSDEIIQDSEEDSKFALTALAERPEFAVRFWVSGRAPVELQDRIAALQHFKNMTTERDITDFAARNRIAWYVLQPRTTVTWPASFLERPQFSCDGIRVYRFLKP